ncbi:MAG: response regulator [Deltaproteobacteria bacterium]|nr:MAG: response regulator [Deltaproteobacteria bacterium]
MRILVVDDEREHGFLLFRILERMGHEPVLAFDPRDALDILRDDRGATVAGVITDVDMPGMTGIDLARRIREGRRRRHSRRVLHR